MNERQSLRKDRQSCCGRAQGADEQVHLALLERGGRLRRGVLTQHVRALNLGSVQGGPLVSQFLLLDVLEVKVVHVSW